MPTLKQITCNIEWSGSPGKPLTEYQTTYTDGAVQTYLAIPEFSPPFVVRLHSNGYIAPGLAMFVYMDGIYQCNRNRHNLKIPDGKMSRKRTEVDFLVRQKEVSMQGSKFLGKDWRFEKIKTENPPDSNIQAPHDGEYIGTIEVVVLRCHPKSLGGPGVHTEAFSDSGSDENTSITISNHGLGSLQLDGTCDDLPKRRGDMFRGDTSWINPDKPRNEGQTWGMAMRDTAETKDRNNNSKAPELNSPADPVSTSFWPSASNHSDSSSNEPKSRGRANDEDPKWSTMKIAEHHIPDTYPRTSERNAGVTPADSRNSCSPLAWSNTENESSTLRKPQASLFSENPTIDTGASLTSIESINQGTRHEAKSYVRDEVPNMPGAWSTTEDPEVTGDMATDRIKAKDLKQSSNRVSDYNQDPTAAMNPDVGVSKWNDWANSGDQIMSGIYQESGGPAPNTTANDGNGNLSEEKDSKSGIVSRLKTKWTGSLRSVIQQTPVEEAPEQLRTPERPGSPIPSHNHWKLPQAGKMSEHLFQRGGGSWSGTNEGPIRQPKQYWTDWHQSGTMIEPEYLRKDWSSDFCVGPEGPLYKVPKDLLKKKAMTHQVWLGKSYSYVHKIGVPEYMDNHEEPYAVFIFNYRSEEIIKKTLKIQGAEMEEDEKEMLQHMSKEEIIEQLMKIKTRAQSSSRRRGGRAGWTDDSKERNSNSDNDDSKDSASSAPNDARDGSGFWNRWDNEESSSTDSEKEDQGRSVDATRAARSDHVGRKRRRDQATATDNNTGGNPSSTSGGGGGEFQSRENIRNFGVGTQTGDTSQKSNTGLVGGNQTSGTLGGDNQQPGQADAGAAWGGFDETEDVPRSSGW